MAKKAKVQVEGLPAGFTLRRDTTKVGDLEYAYEAPQIPANREGVDLLVGYYDSQGHDGWAVLAGVWNAANDQNAKQSPKTAIRKAIDAGEDVEGAIAHAQEVSRTFITGAPRGSLGGGLTKTAARSRGEAIARAQAAAEAEGRTMTPEEMFAIWNNPDLED